MPYFEHFANNVGPYDAPVDYTPEQEAELERQRRQRAAENEERKQAERQRQRETWPYTIAHLRAAIADLPGDMPVIVSDSEYGDMLPEPQVTEDNYTVSGAVLEMGREHYFG
ncbi:MAG: hypothetical protein INR66_14905 [Gordonia polyisoprenivorans]|nr:hypothetical protein [Gordonia polyisoprenivorans]